MAEDNAAKPNRRLSSLRRRFDIWFCIFLSGGLVYMGATLYEYVYFVKINSLVATYGWGHVPRASMPQLNSTLDQVVTICSYLVWAIAFVGGIFAARNYAQAMGVIGHTWSSVAIVITLFVPFASLICPWLGFAEIRRSIMYSAKQRRFDEAWKSHGGFSSMTLLLGLSFCTITVAKAGIASEAKLASTASGLASLVEITPWLTLAIAAGVSVFVVYMVTIRLALRALAREHDRRSTFPEIFA